MTERLASAEPTHVFVRKTREVVSDEKRQAFVERAREIAKDERTAAFVKRAGSLAAAAIVAEHHRRQGQSATALAETDAAARHDGGEMGQAPPLWPPPGWTVDESARTESPEGTGYPSEPVELRVSWAGLATGRAEHKHLRDLKLEVAMTGMQNYDLAIEWPPYVPRIYYSVSEIPTRWTEVRHDTLTLPLELRRSGEVTVMCRWLEPSPAHLQEAGERPDPPPPDPKLPGRLKHALDSIHQRGPSWRA